jgi:hypothetical protein
VRTRPGLVAETVLAMDDRIWIHLLSRLGDPRGRPVYASGADANERVRHRSLSWSEAPRRIEDALNEIVRLEFVEWQRGVMAHRQGAEPDTGLVRQ